MLLMQAQRIQKTRQLFHALTFNPQGDEYRTQMQGTDLLLQDCQQQIPRLLTRHGPCAVFATGNFFEERSAIKAFH